MRIDLYTKTMLTLIVLLLAVIVLKPILRPRVAFAQSGVPYSYLVPQAGDATREGGKHFVDLRNGNLWMCDFKHCQIDGKYPLEKTK